MDRPENVILSALKQPARVHSFGRSEWERCLREARHSGVLARLGVLLDQNSIRAEIPFQVNRRLVSARAVAACHERSLRWEVNRIEQALGFLNAPVILLKGAAYVMAKLPPARGRLYSDVDIMVPKNLLSAAESALLEHGWESAKVNAYDQRYYRSWMHELPPLRHRERDTYVDLHHNILPESGRLHPDAKLLLESAAPISGTIFKVLAPADMVLHGAAHMFQDGELAGSLRDLTDLDDLLRHFSSDSDFWEQLVPRAQRLNLVRPLFYALRYAKRFLGTPVPEFVAKAAADAGGPTAPLLFIMDILVVRALVLDAPAETSWGANLARWLLYVRSHWLRMPPLLLACHLVRKSLRRFERQPAN
jgi:hypothetical protein